MKLITTFRDGPWAQGIVAGSGTVRFCGKKLAATLCLALAMAMSAGAQTTLLFEGFEGIFPTANGWTTGDAPVPATYWKDVYTTFGTVSAHSGSWKGYCAGIGYGGTSTSPTYVNNMNAFMSKSLDFTPYSGANLTFWVNVPSIETSFDYLRVYMDANLIWSTTTATPGWVEIELPLSAYVGGVHTLKFEFDSDFSNVFEGAYLDDILVDGSTQPFIANLQTLQNINYSGYVLDSDTTYGRSNIVGQATFTVENFTGVSAAYSNVLSFRLINANTGAPHPIYDNGNTATNATYTYNITNNLTLAPGTNLSVTAAAYIRPAAWMNEFSQYYIECRMLTNGVLAQTLTTPPSTYYHFTNTASIDTAYNVLLNLTNAAWSRTYAVQSIPGQNTFQVNAGYEVRRWDDLGLPSGTANIPIVFNYKLTDSGGNAVPLVNSSETFYDAVSNYVPVVFIFPLFHVVDEPVFAAGQHTLDIQPAVQLSSVSKTYFVTVTISATNNPATQQVVTANTLQTPLSELLDFNGNLYFGPIGTTLNSLGPPAPPGNPPSGGFIPTSLNVAGGYVTDKTDHTYSGGILNVNLDDSGNAYVTAGSVILSNPTPDTDNIAGVNFIRGPVTLTASGATGNITATLPTGLGYRLNDTNSLVLSAYLPFTSVTLTGSLLPATDLTYLPATTIYAVEESKPVWLVTDRIIWHVNTGQFDLPPIGPGAIYVRALDYAYLASISNSLVDPPTMGDKKSNDKYWLALNGPAQPPTVRPDSNGNALLTTAFAFGSGGFLTHFPYDTAIQWSGGGNLKVVDDLAVVGSSSLVGATQVGVTFTRDCTDCGGGGSGTVTPTITITNNQFSFTIDGGLVAAGTLAPFNLQWGYISSATDFAQTAKAFSDAAFHMPGIFIRGDQNSLSAVQSPSTILYTGFKASDQTVVERPVSAGYSKGLADYAGLNFRAMADNAHGAVSTIANQTGITWSIDARSKYYVRYGGVSGIHEAVPGSFPSTLTLWGYAFTFTSYGLSYLDSQNKDSVTDGAVSLPYPAQFVQGFNNMRFSCLGAPLGGDVPQNDGFKLMAYWVADFKTLSMQFKTSSGCNPGAGGYLVLGVEAFASHVDKPLYGQIGFFSNGDQIPPSFGLAGVTSRLKLPNVINIEGPNKTTYAFTPVEDVYYNTYANSPPSPTAGWMSIFGKLDVPFFEDLQLQLQTSCHTNGVAASNAPIFLSGGWPRAGTTNNNHGWINADGRTPFETNLFDFNNLGWPGSGTIDIAKYRDNTAEDYHPRAQRVWLGFITFDYPLSWDNTLRQFKSWQEIKSDLLVVTVQHQVKYMDATHCEIDFGAQYDGLPTISIANLAFNAINDATGVGDAIAKAAAKPIEDVLATGLDQMDQLLDTQMKRLMDGVFDKTVNPIIDQFYNQLSNDFSGMSLSDRLQFASNVQTNALGFFLGTGPLAQSTTLLSALSDLGDGLNQGNNLIGQIEGYISNATNAIESIVGVIDTTTNGTPLGSNIVGLISQQGGSRPVVPKMLQSLVGDIAPQFIDAVIGPTVSNLTQEIDPALSEITDGLKQTEDALAQVNGALGQAGEFTTEINNTLNSFSGQLSNVSFQVSLSVTQYFGQFDYNIDNPFQHVSASDVKQFIRQKVEDQFFGTDAAASIQTALRQRVYDVDSAMKQEVDSVFQQFNGMMRDLISQSLAEVDNSINKCLGQVSDVMGAGKLNGHADIVGDSLKLLRIDGHFQFKVPDDMELDAFLEIKDLTSDGNSGCYSTNAPATEVTIGANGIPLDFAGTDAKANIEAKFTFDNTSYFPVNLGGQLSLIGELDFEAFQLHDLAAAMAFGKYENYIALKGGVKFNGYDFSGAVFFGRTCSLDPLILIDPDVAKVLGDPPFTGAYCYAQGWLPISEMVLGIPASCLFEISAGVGAGAFYFAEGPTYGGKMFLGVSGSLLCIVSIEGDVTLIGVKHGDDLRFDGHGHFEADLGPCPFCISISKDIEMEYINKSWHIE
jgi:hypothetical protein